MKPLPKLLPGVSPACPPELRDVLLYLCLSLWEQPDKARAERILQTTLKKYSLTKKELYPWLRYGLTGQDDSPPIEDLLYALPVERSVYRLARLAATSLGGDEDYFVPEMV